MLERMEALALRLERNRREQESASNEMQSVIVESYSEGCSPSFIARTLGVSRQTVYTALKKA